MNTTKQTELPANAPREVRNPLTGEVIRLITRDARDAVQSATGEGNAPREIVQVGWDGRSQPIYRYRDELHLNEWMQARVYPPQNLLPVPNLKS